VDPAKITQLLVFLNHPKADHSFEIHGIRADGGFVTPTAWSTDAPPFSPFIDTFGQYRHKDWPGKAKSVEDLARRREAESSQLEPDRGPNGWNRFGGWADGPQLEATGFFRVQKHEGKWWFVDPEGRLFWSHGIDCVRMLDVPPIEARDAWFADRATAIRAAAAPNIARAQRASNATIDTAQVLQGYLAADLAALDRQKAAATVAAPEPQPETPARRRR